MSSAELTTLVGRLETVTFKLEKMAYQQSSVSAGVGETFPPSVIEYDRIIAGPLKNFLTLSATIGSDVKKQADMVSAAFQAQRHFLVTASKTKVPPQDVLNALLKPTSDQIQAIQAFREANRSSVFFNHLSAISESIPALGWVTMPSTPGPFVKEMSDASQFYTNRVLKDYKDKDKTHVDWTRAWLLVLGELQAYIKQYHTTGLMWNPKGSDAISSAPSAPAPPSFGAPPPPPLPPPEFFADATSNDADDARAALFRDINKGQDITRGLRKVTSEEQTHKNPALRQQAGQTPKIPSTAPRPFKPVTAPVQIKPPRFELEGKKWCIEYQTGNKGLLVSQTEMNQSVIAYRCQDCLITVKGKINSITLDSCKKTCIVFDDLVSFVEFINCQSVQAQSMGKVPTVAIDKTDGALIYLSPQSLEAEIVTSKSSEVNVSIPQGDGDFIEHPIPEQFKSVWTGKGMKTVPVDIK